MHPHCRRNYRVHLARGFRGPVDDATHCWIVSPHGHRRIVSRIASLHGYVSRIVSYVSRIVSRHGQNYRVPLARGFRGPFDDAL